MYHFDFETEIAGSTVGLLGTIDDNGAIDVAEVRVGSRRGRRCLARLGCRGRRGARRVRVPFLYCQLDAAVALPPVALRAYLAAHRPEIDDIVRDHAHAASAAAYEARWSR